MAALSKALRAALLHLSLALAPGLALSAINLLPPGRTVDPSQPLRLSLIVTGERDVRTYAVPEMLRVSLSPDLGAPTRIEMRRETVLPDMLDLKPGEFIRVDFVGEVPANLRGRVRIDVTDLDAPGMVVQLSTPRATAVADAAAPPATVAAAGAADAPAPAPTPVATPESIPAPTTTLTVRSDNDPNRADEGRLTFLEPMYAIVGGGTDSNANFQISFKLRVYEPEDKNSRGILGNTYLGYTQNSFWDLTSDSKPFTDTNYAPSVFYFVPATGWRLGGNAVGLAAGYEHESNGRDGLESRSIDILFARPYFRFGDTSGFHWSVSPKVYAYLDKEENPEITQYRGYADLHVSYGKHDDWQLSTMLRSGTKSNTYSATVRGTYPLNRLVPGLSGYFMAQFFNGYGENLLGYNERDSSSFRIGYAISR